VNVNCWGQSYMFQTDGLTSPAFLLLLNVIAVILSTVTYALRPGSRFLILSIVVDISAVSSPSWSVFVFSLLIRTRKL